MDDLTRDALLLLLEAVHAERSRANSLAVDITQLSAVLTTLRELHTPEEEARIDKKLRELAIQSLGLRERSDETLSKLAAMAKKVDQTR